MAGGFRLPELPTILVAGHHFFTDTVPLAPATVAREIPALAALAIEQEAPFSEEQLARGYYAAAEGGLVVFAALRRKFVAAQEGWGKAGFVFPDFATWLPRGSAKPGIVVLETAEAVTALEYAAGSVLPRRIVSRPVPAAPAAAEAVVAVSVPAAVEGLAAVVAAPAVDGAAPVEAAPLEGERAVEAVVTASVPLSVDGPPAVVAAPAAEVLLPVEGAAPVVGERPAEASVVVVAPAPAEVVPAVDGSASAHGAGIVEAAAPVAVPAVAEAAVVVERSVAVAAPVAFDGVAIARAQVLARIAPGERPVWRYRLADIPCTVKGSRYHFHWVALAGAPESAAELAAFVPAQLWAMDLRESDSVRTKRRDFQWNRIAWGTLLGLGGAAVLLVLAEVVILGGQLWLHSRQTRIDRQVPSARLAETNHDVVERLSAYIDRKPQPLEQLAYVNDLRPRSIYFTKVSVEGGTQMVIEGATSALAEVNEFESALTRSGGFASVGIGNVRAREGGGTFQLSLNFRPAVSNSAVAPVKINAALPAPAAAEPAPAVPAPAPAVPMPIMPPRPPAAEGPSPVMPGSVPEASPSGMPPQPSSSPPYDPRSMRRGVDPRASHYGPVGRQHPSLPEPDASNTPPAQPSVPGEAQPAPTHQ